MCAHASPLALPPPPMTPLPRCVRVRVPHPLWFSGESLTKASPTGFASGSTERTAGLHLQRLYEQPLTHQLLLFFFFFQVKLANKTSYILSHDRATTENYQDRTMRSGLGLCVLGLLCLHNLVKAEVRD